MKSIKRILFIEHYLVTGSGVQAARLAGYSTNPSNLRTRASRLLNDSNIWQQIEIRIIEIQNKTNQNLANTTLTAENILKNLQKIAETATNQSVKLRALEILGKHFNLWSGEAGQSERDKNIKEFYRYITSDDDMGDKPLLPDSKK